MSLSVLTPFNLPVTRSRRIRLSFIATGSSVLSMSYCSSISLSLSEAVLLKFCRHSRSTSSLSTASRFLLSAINFFCASVNVSAFSIASSFLRSSSTLAVVSFSSAFFNSRSPAILFFLRSCWETFSISDRIDVFASIAVASL